MVFRQQCLSWLKKHPPKITGHSNRLTAYYADSFGHRPDRFGPRTALPPGAGGDDVVLSYSAVRAALRTAHAVGAATAGVDFVDVSVGQQRDVGSCGVFALENAHR